MHQSRISFLLRTLFLFFLLVAIGAPMAYGQKKVKLRKADEARRGKRNGDRYERLIGNVVFVQNKTTIYCDSAHFFKRENNVDAFGHVRILDGDSVTITGSRLNYDGDTKKAKLRNRVVFTKLGTATLYTDNLDFSRPNNIAYYFNGGRLVDSANTLTSDKGYYNLNSNMASFKKNVKVVNPDYTMYSDSLRYNSKTKIIYFVTPTTVVNKDSSTFIYEKGVYHTTTKVSDVVSGRGESEDYTIEGIKYDYDGLKKIGKVRGNVVMTSKKENLIIFAQASDHYENTGITKVYNNAYLAKITDNNDTLYMSADTLVSIDNEDVKKERLLAYNNVKIYKSDLQGVADSVEYRTADSTIFFYRNPVLWTQGNQMTADSISMLIQNNTISKVFLVVNAFVIAQDTLLNFNQIKGKRMTAELLNSKIHKVVVIGNGESIYYALDETNTMMMGMNRIICSNITLRFKNGKADNFSFYVRPDAQFIPPHELKKEDKTLKGFTWKADLKPSRNDVVKPQGPVLNRNN